MALEFDSRIGMAGLAVSAIGIAIANLWPDKKWVGWIFLVVGAGIVLYWGVLEIKQGVESRHLSLVLSIIFGCAVGGFAGALLWSSARSRNTVSAKDAAASVLLSVACDNVSLPMAYRGPIWFLDTLMFHGMGKMESPQEAFWPQPGVYGFGYKCTVKNYGTQTAFGVSLVLDVAVQDWIPGPHGAGSWQSGDTRETRKVPVLIPQPLGQHGIDEFTFYICSHDTKSAYEVHIPTTGTIESNDSSDRREVEIKVASIRNPLSVPAMLLNAKPAKRRKK